MGTWVTDTKVEYQLSEFPNDAFDLGALLYEIQHSAIEVAVDLAAGLGGAANGGCSINFNSILDSSNRTLLDAVIAAHTGDPIPTTEQQATYDEDGRLITATQPSLLGSGTWLVSDNICSTNLPSSDPSWGGNPPAAIGTTHANGGVIVYEWVPSSGKKLYCLETQLILSKDVDLSSVTCHFAGVNCGTLGTTAFDRTYNGEWYRSGYRVQADDVYSDANEDRFYWRYTVPIILKSSASAKIVLTRSGQMTGTYAYVKIKVISLDE